MGSNVSVCFALCNIILAPCLVLWDLQFHVFQIEEWKPIFDKFDVEADGKSDGKIPLQKFAEILDCDPIWKVTCAIRLFPRPLHIHLIFLSTGGFQRNFAYLGWPIAPSYMSPNMGPESGELRGLSQWVQPLTRAKINFGDLTPYLTYDFHVTPFRFLVQDFANLFRIVLSLSSLINIPNYLF